MDTLPEVPNKKFGQHKVIYGVLILAIMGIWAYYVMSAPTSNQSRANGQPTVIHISSGDSLSKVALDLENKKVVRYSVVLKIFLTVFKFDRQIEKGDYLFKESMPVWRVAWMLATSDHNVDPIKVTFKEGITNEEMADLLGSKIQAFRRDLFLSDNRSKQGYLFPDTYFFFALTTSDEIVTEMTSNFNNRMKKFEAGVNNSGASMEDIITMASILEKEAKGKEDAYIISGILWKRMRLGMPLQVDAARETYTRTGLPSVPIANPGAMTIDASINPSDSPYLFYLHDRKGVTHYGKTFAEHKDNINKYLR